MRPRKVWILLYLMIFFSFDCILGSLIFSKEISIQDLALQNAKQKVEIIKKRTPIYSLKLLEEMFNLAEAYRESRVTEAALYVYQELVNTYLSTFGKRLRDNEFARDATCRIIGICGPLDKGFEWFNKLVSEYEPNDITTIIEEDRIELMKNYSDFEGEPLAMFLKSEYVQHNDLFEIKQKIYETIISKYPECKLAPYLKFKLANSYRNMIKNNIKSTEAEHQRNTAVNLYNDIVQKHPDAVFPNSKTKICPIAQMRIADLFNLEGRPISNPLKAITEYNKVINTYPDIIDEKGFKLKINAYMEVLDIYTNRWGDVYTKEYKNIEKAKQIIEILLNIPNEKYLVQEWWFGSTHPECYIRLAEIENESGNIENSIIFYKKVLKEFPNVWTGKYGSDDTTSYLLVALSEILQTKDNNQDKINVCKEIISGDFDKIVKGIAQFVIAEVYEKLGQKDNAIDEYQKVIEKYYEISMYGDESLGEAAKNRIAALRNVQKEK